MAAAVERIGNSPASIATDPIFRLAFPAIIFRPDYRALLAWPAASGAVSVRDCGRWLAKVVNSLVNNLLDETSCAPVALIGSFGRVRRSAAPQIGLKRL
jgi:hypothetical protein